MTDTVFPVSARPPWRPTLLPKVEMLEPPLQHSHCSIQPWAPHGQTVIAIVSLWITKQMYVLFTIVCCAPIPHPLRRLHYHSLPCVFFALNMHQNSGGGLSFCVPLSSLLLLLAVWIICNLFLAHFLFLHKIVDFLSYTPCPEKNGTNNILGVTLTKFNKFSQFLAQFILTYQLTKKF